MQVSLLKCTMYNVYLIHFYLYLARLGSIEIQSRSSLDRSPFLARYRPRRANFYVSCVLKILFPYTRDTLNVSDESQYCIGVGVADTYFLYRDQPCIFGARIGITVGTRGGSG